jgi:peptide/nickel transport system permease protein
MPGGMYRFVARRIILILPMFLIASALLFSLLWVMPGDPAQIMAGPQAGPEQVEKIRHDTGLDRPPHIVYFEWLGGIFHGDFGRSYQVAEQREVSDMILERLPLTIELGIATFLFSVGIGIPLGIIAALRRKTKVDYTCMGIALFGVSIPNFWQALMAILIVGVWLGWSPALGGHGGPAYLILPAITLGTALSGSVSRLTRSTMLDVLRQDYIRSARAKGLRERTVIFAHALKNAAIPISTLLFMRLPWIFGGSIIIETIFQWPGMGWLMISAIRQHDFLVIQGVALMFVVLVMIANLLADISYAYLNPRIRYGAGR